MTDHPGGAAGRALADVVVTNPAGEPVRLASLWETRPLVLVLLRHFG